MHRLVYAAEFVPSPGTAGWLVIRHDAAGLRRVDEVSDWLLVVAATGASPNTLKSLAEALALWWRWCLESGVDPLRADAVQFARFVSALQTVPKGLPLASPIRALRGDPRLRSAATVSQRVIHIKTFYRWAMHNGRVSAVAGRAISGFKAPKVPRTMTAVRLGASQIRALEAVSLAPRDRFTIELLYCAGLREGEALGLMVEDWCVNRDVAAVFGCRVPGGAHLHVRRRLNSNGALAKSPYERVIPIVPRLLLAYRDWTAWAFDHAPESVESSYLLISLAGPTRGRPWSISGFTSMWRTKIQSLAELQAVTPHLLRHEWASGLSDAGVPPFTIQELLGHRSPSSTRIYTHAQMETLMTAVTQLAAWRQRAFGIAG